MIQDFIQSSFKTSAAVLTALKYRDACTEAHCTRVATLAWQMGANMGLVERELGCMVSAAVLHDVGKIGIPDHILLHTGPLNQQEIEVIRGHSEIGEQIVGQLDIPTASEVAVLVRWHHERLDGQGYPDGLKGSEVPLMARIISAADAYDALTSERTYRNSWANQTAIDELTREQETRFGSNVISALRDVLKGRKLETIIGSEPLACR
ncbi:MAG: HD domain-containing protein [Chromatiales bacterium]|nr:HD domain-containing protein [Chromatiales bacterium]